MRRPRGLLAQLWQWRTVATVLGLVVWSGLLLQNQLRFAANNNAHHGSGGAGAYPGSSLAVDDDDFGSPQPHLTTSDTATALSRAVERVDEEVVEGKVVVRRVERVEAKGVYKPFRTAVDLLEEDPNDVPSLVRAWRRGLLDFHDIKYSPLANTHK
jgi:hypothetical protein